MKCDIARWNTSDIKTSEKCNKQQTNSILIDFNFNRVAVKTAKSTQVANAMVKGEERSSKKERRVDALALRADERRDKLRKASGRSKYPLIRRSLNGETHHISGIHTPIHNVWRGTS